MAEAPSLDLAFVRAQFPALGDPEIGRWAHLENAGGSYAAQPVIDLLTDLFSQSKVQPGWDFAASRRATAAMDRSRDVMAATFAADPATIHFGPSTSQNTYVLAAAMRPMWDAGDEIIVTEQDHEANSGVWRRLADTGIVVRDWCVDPVSGLLDLADLEAMVSDRTRLVAMTHASNLAATINPVAEAAQLVHDRGGHLVVDGVSYAPHSTVDVGALGCDVYLYSAYKTFGPHVGMMYTDPDLLRRVTHQGHDFNEPHLSTRLTPAGPDHAVIGATGGIADYYDLLHGHHFDPEPDRVARMAAVSDLFRTHESALMAPLLDILRDRDGVRIVGSTDADTSVREPTIAFASGRASSQSIYEALIAADVACGHGHFYARRLVEALGLDLDDGVVRVSMVHYNTAEEVARAVEVIDALV